MNIWTTDATDKRRRALSDLTDILRAHQDLPDGDATLGLDRRDPPGIQLCEGVTCEVIGYVDAAERAITLTDLGAAFPDLWRHVPEDWTIYGPDDELWLTVCPTCDGTGRVHVQRGYTTTGSGYGDASPDFRWEECTRCDGSGEVRS